MKELKNWTAIGGFQWCRLHFQGPGRCSSIREANGDTSNTNRTGEDRLTHHPAEHHQAEAGEAQPR